MSCCVRRCSAVVAHVCRGEARLAETPILPLTTSSPSPRPNLLTQSRPSAGTGARPDERTRVANIVQELEAAQPEPTTLCDGTWELICSDVEPFRASVFFLALGEAVEANIMSGAADGALTVHSLATGGGEVGRVAHVIEDGGTRLHSLVELRSGSLPSLPLALSGTVISSGELSQTSQPTSTYALSLKNTSVQDNRVMYGLPREGSLRPDEQRGMLSWIGDQVVSSGEIFSSVLEPLGGGQEAALLLSYADDEIMVWRTPRLGNHFFVLARGDDEAWPAMEELRARQAAGTTSRSPVGSAFALGMLNPFFSRRMRQR